MPQLPRRRSHSRNMQIALRRLRLLKKATDHNHESSRESDDEEKIIDDLFDILQNFNDKVTLDDISDIFELCKNIIIDS